LITIFFHHPFKFIIAIVCIGSFPIFVMAGPPFRTDDPTPVDYHHWEFYLASQVIKNTDGLSGIAPYGEINYGIIKGVHIHLNVPLAFNDPRHGAADYGPGDVEFGFKWQLINESGNVPQIGTFPVIEIPTGNAEKQLGAGGTQFFVPVWLQKTWGPWATYCGGGYLVTVTSVKDNSLFLGWEAQRDVSRFLTIGTELFSTLFSTERSENELGFNIGATVNFNEIHHFLFSTGRDIMGKNTFFFYAAYQGTIGPGR
jgi:hypothetical protein